MDETDTEVNQNPSEISESLEDFSNELSDPDPITEQGMPPLKRTKAPSMRNDRKKIKKISGVVAQQVKSRVQISSVVKLFVKKVHPSHVSGFIYFPLYFPIKMKF